MSKWDELWENKPSTAEIFMDTKIGFDMGDFLHRLKDEGDRLQDKANKMEEYYRAMREFQERNSDQARQIRQLKGRTGICTVCGNVCV